MSNRIAGFIRKGPKPPHDHFIAVACPWCDAFILEERDDFLSDGAVYVCQSCRRSAHVRVERVGDEEGRKAEEERALADVMLELINLVGVPDYRKVPGAVRELRRRHDAAMVRLGALALDRE